MTSKIDIRTIVADHLSTFRDDANGAYSYVDFFVMLLFPVFISLCASLTSFHIRDDHIGTLISAFAIFGGLLFNVLVLIYSFSDGPENKVRDKLIQQTFANISFSVLSSLFAVVFLVILLFVEGLWQSSVEFLIYFLGINFLLTMLMVLKRIHILLRGKFENLEIL